jgi:hypothetical protein
VSAANKDRAKVIRFWRGVEFFGPQSIPKVNSRKRVYQVAKGGLLPWERGHPLRGIALPESRTWRHTVYGGIFSLQSVRALLEAEFGSDGESFDSRPLGDSALFAVTVTDEGRPLVGSGEFASCAWATGRLLRPGPKNADWLSGFEDARAEFHLKLGQLVAAPDEDARATELRTHGHELGRRVDASQLSDFVAEVADRLGVATALRPTGIRVASVQLSKRWEFTVDGGDFINSFFAADLARVADAVAEGNYGAALGAYLKGPGHARERIDLRARPGVVDGHVSPEHIPAGRWPAKTSQSLALSQQFAANTVIGELADTTGIFAVNGPPGTGKTTMLRELVAAIVVERARRLAELAHPGDAFTGKSHWKTGDHVRTVSMWREGLTGFEIVVASSNNGAVENISREIPSQDAIDKDEWLGGASYYAELATAVLNSNNDGTKPEVSAWGLVAGCLGKKANRQKFADAFWFGKAGDAVTGFQGILQDYERSPGDWPSAVHLFRASLREVDRLRAERVDVHLKLAEIPATQSGIGGAQTALAAARERHEKISVDIAAAARAVESAQRKAVLAMQGGESHWLLRPGFFSAPFGLGRRAREWRARGRELAVALAEAERQFRVARSHSERLTEEQRETEEMAQRYGTDLAALHARLKRLNHAVADAAARWGAALPVQGHRADSAERELRAPWNDPEWNAARSRLFLGALQLHQAFLEAEPTRMRKSLHAAVDVLKGTVPPGTPEEAVRAAWQSLFFVVPVLSTTFASLPRVFSHLGRESLGWLFIDEAGQATPQAAAGAIWRAQRAVVVGDPMQIEPVVTLPFTAQQALRAHYGAGEWSLPSKASAQSLADQANVYGTYLPAEGDAVWVGAPLRVHRRCDEPMFTISNTIAYGGLMVCGTAERSEPLAARESVWIHVPAAESEGHWVPREGEQARKILNALLHRYNVEPEQIFVISPFRDVADHIEKLCREVGGLRGGTVHTAQGKEADVVVLILGGDPGKPGARKWASERPNLLNVAVSRARQRLYVIGDLDAWSGYPHFRVLAKSLPPWPPRGGADGERR